jgi:hypothetical protein
LSDKENVSSSEFAYIKPEIIWKEQEKAIERNDSESFESLEELHRQNNIPRPNDISELFANEYAVEEMLPKLTLEEIQRAEEIIAKNSYLQGSTFNDYIKQQNFEAGNEVSKQLQKPLTPEELQYLNNFKTTDEMNQRFAQIQQSEKFHAVC